MYIIKQRLNGSELASYAKYMHTWVYFFERNIIYLNTCIKFLFPNCINVNVNDVYLFERKCEHTFSNGTNTDLIYM